MSSEASKVVSPANPVADPTPLAISGFSSIVLMVGLYYAHIIDNLSFLMPLGFFAAAALLIGSFVQFRNNITLTATTFGIYGLFWMCIAIFLMNDKETDKTEVISYLRIPMAIFTAYVWVAALHVSKVAVIIFTMLELNYLFCIIGYFANSEFFNILGGIAGIICATAGYYLAASSLLKPYVTMPLGEPFLKPHTLKFASLLPLHNDDVRASLLDHENKSTN